MHIKRFVFLPLAAVAAILCLSLVAVPAYANPGISLTPFASIKVDVTPGETLTHQMELTLGEQDQAVDMAVDVMGFGSSLDGSPQGIAAVQDTSPYSARSFISVDKSSFHLEPGQSQDIMATIVVPANVGEGGRYAIIYFHEQQPAGGGGGAGSLSAFNIPVLLTITGSTLIHTGKITAITTGEAISGQPVNILTDFLNTGNHHFKVQGEVTVKNAQGQTLDTLAIPVTASSILPGVTRQLQTTLAATDAPAAGTYNVDAKIKLEDGTLLDEVNNTFEVTTQSAPPPAAGTIKPTPSSASTEVTAQSVPPPAVGTLTLTPSSASTLKNTDGTISINFPQGAAVTTVEVSLKNYFIDQISALPSGLTPASTCFRVDGLTGLLAKEAIVTVKYSAADLIKAGGDASKLKLARWDEGVNQWTVLKTNIDEGTMTLSAASNQMSIWAVVVDSSPARAGWVIPVAIAAGIIVVAIVAILGVVWRRRK